MDGFPVFDQWGKMLGNTTSNFGQIPNSLPTLPDFPSFPGNTLSKVAPSISTGIPGTAPASSVPAGVASGQPSTPASNSAPADVWQNYLTRGAVIVLGFIFVAVGLTMFGVRTNVGQNMVREVRNSIPK